jgi:hypothetical protein
MRFGVAAAALIGAAQWCRAAKSVTVGDFLVEIAKARSLSAADPLTARAALTASGVTLPNLALDKSLTQGDVVQIGGSMGVNVTTSDPTAAFDSSQVGNFISTFGRTIAGSGDGGTVNPFSHPNPGSDQGRGKKKGHNKSPSDPV